MSTYMVFSFVCKNITCTEYKPLKALIIQAITNLDNTNFIHDFQNTKNIDNRLKSHPIWRNNQEQITPILTLFSSSISLVCGRFAVELWLLIG